MNTQQTRHEIEYEWFPEAAYSDMASDFVNLVMVHKQELLVELYKRWNANIPNYHCPYDANDFQIDASLIGNIAGIIRITMPPALADGDFIRLYICHDTNFSNVRLYSVMIDSDGDLCFMTWIDDSHYKNHGKFVLSEQQELETVQTFYLNYLKENAVI